MEQTRVTVKEAAQRLGTSELTVRWGIIEGTLPIGSYIKIPGSCRTTFIIPRERFENFLKGGETSGGSD